MKRRNFLKNTTGAVGGSFLLNGLPIKAFAGTKMFNAMTLNEDAEDRIIVMIQLHGGNDGINNLVTIDQYAEYFSLRENLAIPNSGARSYINIDQTIDSSLQVGLHPDMTAMKELYDQGKLNIVHNVGYNNVDQSHFRSRDIYWMGGGYDTYASSGWMGRYLDCIYPNYPENYPNPDMPDPLGLEIGNLVSLGYHRDNGIPTALATTDVENFSDLIGGLGGPPMEDYSAGNYYTEKAELINNLYENANDYSDQLLSRFNAGSNNTVYPSSDHLLYPNEAPGNVIENELGWQLQTVARLINGGCKTKIYLVKLHRFDTHDDQVVNGDPTYGRHAALLFHLSNAIKAFQDDLAISGNDEKVVGFTFSEFGRRPYSNGSFGTDHGTAAPMYVFGKGVNPGLTGEPADLVNTDSSDNLLVSHDYRQVFTTLLVDWMGATENVIDKVDFTEFLSQKLPIIHEDYIVNGTSVPVTISSINAWSEKNTNYIQWKVSEEINVEHYDIYKSTDGKRFKKIGKENAIAMNLTSYEYLYPDHNISEGTSFYRVHAVDFDGHESISNIVSVIYDRNISAKIYPNPFADFFHIELDAENLKGNSEFVLKDITGRQIMSRTLGQAFNNQYTIELEDLMPGNYFSYIIHNDRIIFKSLLAKID
jgi:uncharacterized protein (DUF1501 family)